MTLARLKETLLQLPRQTKFIGLGAFLLGFSVFFPWYADLDRYRVGDEFLGVTGPTSFFGIVILALASVSFWIFSYHLLERRVPRLPVREGILHLFTAGQSLFLLLLVNSVFFHTKFGVNILAKESRFGMLLAFAGAGILFIGAYLKNREELSEDSETGKLEPLIKIESSAQPSPSSHVQTPSSARPHTPVREALPRRIVDTQKQRAASFMFGEPKSAASASRDTRLNSAGAPPPQPHRSEPSSATGKPIPRPSSGSGSFVIRTDL